MAPKSIIRILSLIHTSLFISLVVFAAFAYLKNGNFLADMNRNDLLIYIVPVIAISGYFASQFLFRKQLQGIKREENLQTKLGKYKAASILKYALLEGPAFLALIGYYISGNALHLAIGAFLMAYLFVQRPTFEKLEKDIPLTVEEQKQFDTISNRTKSN